MLTRQPWAHRRRRDRRDHGECGPGEIAVTSVPAVIAVTQPPLVTLARWPRAYRARSPRDHVIAANVSTWTIFAPRPVAAAALNQHGLTWVFPELSPCGCRRSAGTSASKGSSVTARKGSSSVPGHQVAHHQDRPPQALTAPQAHAASDETRQWCRRISPAWPAWPAWPA
jgi:hypothetical protein